MEFDVEKTRKFAEEHQNDNVYDLLLHADKFPDVNIKAVVNQIKGRKITKSKIPAWHKNQCLIYPDKKALEQCSSEATAKFKASLVSGETMVDLTGGLGVDTAFLSEKFLKVHYVEPNKKLFETAAYNFNYLDLQHVKCYNLSAPDFLNQNQDNFDLIYLDPDRRPGKNNVKKIMLHDHQPDVITLKNKLLSRANTVMLKTSPMLDIQDMMESLPETTAVHVIAAMNECKELLVLLEKKPAGKKIIAVNIDKNSNYKTFDADLTSVKNKKVNFSLPLNYLFEPNAALLKAGLQDVYAEQKKIFKLHSNSQLYTSNNLFPGFFGRSFRIIKILPFDRKQVSATLKSNKANITVRNFPVSVEEIRKKIKLKEGGEDYLFATTLNNGQKRLILCRKI